MQKSLYIVIILIAILADLTISYAQVLEGALSGRITAGDYLVIGNIRVEEYDSLQIFPGARFEFAGHYAFDIYGFVSAVGNLQDSIVFIPESSEIVWSGINFNESSDEESTLSFCLVTGSDSAGITIDNSSPSISNSSIIYNTGYAGGGGVFCYQAGPVISNCNISFNQAYFGGGGVNCFQADPVVENCVINHNSAENGGGIYVYQCGSAEIRDCVISYNESGGRGGGLQIKNSAPIIERCEISENVTLNNGGGIDCYNAEPLIKDCTIRENSAFIGGGICNFSSDYLITGTTLIANWSNNGGGIYCDPNSDLTVSECLFEYNSASTGAGILCEQFGTINVSHTIIRWHYSNYGSGIYCSNAYMDLSHCLFIENEAAYDGSAVFYGTNSQGNISNCIFFHNLTSSCIGFGTFSNINTHYSDFYDNYSQNFSGDIPPGLGVINMTNLNGDSCDIYSNLYVDPVFYSMTGDSIYYLSSESPCIDAGDPNSTLDPDSTIADIGRYYYHHGLNTISELTIEIENDNIIMDWEDIPNVNVYKIYKYEVPEINVFLSEPYDEISISQYTDYNALNENEYFYRVIYTLE